ncbi:MAG TPA: cobaltochelatase subunit CobN [Devosia sp.]|nr:cobaltochelatase subunit CobN [Devosia sp.]
MHLLAAQSGALQQEGEAIDLGQTPANIIFASAADSELSAVAGAVDRAGTGNVRLANVLTLAHNMSVDLWLDQTVRRSKLVVVRLLGGASYWSYGVDELCALAATGAFRLALLPGDANPDPDLLQRSTITKNDWHHLHALFTAGGPDNLDLALAAFTALAENRPVPEQKPRPFPRFGCWWPEEGMLDLDALARIHQRTRLTRPTPEPDAPRPEPAEGEGERNFFAPILFYRAALEGAGTATLVALVEKLQSAGLSPVPLVVSTLKEGPCIRFVQTVFKQFPPEIILNLTGFALGLDGIKEKQNPFAKTDGPIIQLVQGGRPEELWQSDAQGLSAKDLAMQIVLPEMDGRIGALLVGHKTEALWHEATQCKLSTYAPDRNGIARAAELTANWVKLRNTSPQDRRVAIVLANYPIRDGRIANGVGYDAPQSTVEILKALEGAGYCLAPTLPAGIPPHKREGNEAASSASPSPLWGGVRGGGYEDSANALIEALQQGPTNANPERGTGGAILPMAEYLALFALLPEKIRNEVTARWGAPQSDPFCRTDGFHLPVLKFGNVAILLQPARGYDRDIEASYHDPDLVPPHAYFAAYLWLKHRFNAHALVHNGKHGNLEWLPGKATALDEASYPLALWGALPHLYPFIVNDPGEGTQAKRRTGTVIIDHLVPPLTRAETYGPLKDLEALLDEYYAASGMDRRRLSALKKRILDFTRDAALDKDLSLPQDEDEALGEIDNFLCELKEAQIRDGLHIFGQSPTGDLERDLVVALSRVPRGEGAGEASLIRALADDLKLGFDPLSAKLGEKWRGPKPVELANLSDDLWRSNGDTIERLELLAASLVEASDCPKNLPATGAVLETIKKSIRPALAACGPNEIKSLLEGLDGKFVAPGPSGAPSRGRLDVLPTGRNFYSVDNRALPTPTAWELGQKSAENLLKRHFQDHGVWLSSIALSVWGTANMRTGGDDVAQAMALIGVRPKWDPGSLRVTGYEIIPLSKLGRPRVDVTLRISGFFRDAFPQLIVLFDRAVRAIGALDEPAGQNPIAATMRTDALELMEGGKSEHDAALSAGHRIFGSKPGAYGAGLQGLMDSGDWKDKGDLAKAFLNWGQYAYGNRAKGIPERARFAARLGSVEAVVHNQDNREHDLLDSDDYYQFEGGLITTIQSLSSRKPAAYHNDHSRPERPVTRTLEEEISHVMRSRVVNPKWLNGVMRHGYKGAFEIIATLDYMFAFAATTGAVKTHHFDLAFKAFVEDEKVQQFIKQNNRHGYDELMARFNEAVERGLWTPKSNSVYDLLSKGKYDE